MYDVIGTLIGLILIGGLLAPIALTIYIFLKM
jgi:hypothetical protein